ncbi:MAG: M24 family metallopeptidase, partial [Bacilli bacterium]|nr:M24 family metallopeptidase [Bacilli bacterium]
EVNDIKEAIKVTHLGLKRIVKELKTANNEMEIYNAFNHEILNHGTHEIGFPSIIATGVHTCCLHYPTPTDKIDRSSLILCDVGAAYNHYSSDVTRTYPISGKFNDLQKKIYSIVLLANKTIIDAIRPGIMLKDLQELTKKTLIKGCLDAGLVKEANELEKYYFHNVSHHLGLDTHDASDKEKPLAPGMVITVEPGLYFKEHKIGVRIEDDVLVTKDGHEVLSKEIAKEIEDIEKLFIGGN